MSPKKQIAKYQEANTEGQPLKATYHSSYTMYTLGLFYKKPARLFSFRHLVMRR